MSYHSFTYILSTVCLSNPLNLAVFPRSSLERCVSYHSGSILRTCQPASHSARLLFERHQARQRQGKKLADNINQSRRAHAYTKDTLFQSTFARYAACPSALTCCAKPRAGCVLAGMPLLETLFIPAIRHFGAYSTDPWFFYIIDY